MDIILIALAAFGASVLTFFSGFGLGTLLMPVFAIFLPVELAIAATAVVHFANNIFKFGLLYRRASWQVVLRFGIPAMLAAVAGSYLLLRLQTYPPLYSYTIGGAEFHITTLKLLIGLLLFLFALADILPGLQHLHFSKNMLIPGGIISGFFGGLSGHQGALRSAFLIKAGLSKEGFIATGVAVACFVDVGRLLVYSKGLGQRGGDFNWQITGVAIAAAIAGTLLGNRLLAKTTLQKVQQIVFVLLVLMAMLLGLGIV